MVARMTNPGDIQQHEEAEEPYPQRGRPMPSWLRFEKLPKVPCWNCGKPIIIGTVPQPKRGEPYVVQCMRGDCKARNVFYHPDDVR